MFAVIAVAVSVSCVLHLITKEDRMMMQKMQTLNSPAD
jgi:hypothetical protein